ncbi:Hsp20/alpha crystallin family protein [Billgrantia gudaonensis]|uniref:Molecular chaperone IbpA, HSP20 family n=1 Tax=Billgrantia gudaonensis TaxID=376427 RepID=A0A1G9CJH8_9GAMM|nr:Hsp20/alpha crystallin family protein [Halomonas gudaonensis]SDK51831.1 Molecular chaperone IbpA, HSP20 family [Halomonas gudaonensis]
MNEVSRQQAGQQPQTTDQQAREPQTEPAMLPPVDIFEADNALHMIVDMPGVTRDALRIEVDNNVLSLEGDIQLDMPEGMSAIYAEVRAQRFARRFTLSHEIDSEAIAARIDNGVVHVTLPKKQSHHRRRIEVQAA